MDKSFQSKLGSFLQHIAFIIVSIDITLTDTCLREYIKHILFELTKCWRNMGCYGTQANQNYNVLLINDFIDSVLFISFFVCFHLSLT